MKVLRENTPVHNICINITITVQASIVDSDSSIEIGTLLATTLIATMQNAFKLLISYLFRVNLNH